MKKGKMAAFMQKGAKKFGGKSEDKEPEEPEESAAEEEEESDIDVDEIAEDIRNGDGDPEMLRLAKGVTEKNNPPKWVADKATWVKAKKAVQPKWDDYDEPYAVVATVYKNMGGTIRE